MLPTQWGIWTPWFEPDYSVIDLHLPWQHLSKPDLYLASACFLLLDVHAHAQLRRGNSCCVSSKWPQACWSQVKLALLSPCLPRGINANRKSNLPCCHRAFQEASTPIASQTCPAVTGPSKRHQRRSQVKLALSWSPSSSFLTGAVIVRHKLVLPPIIPEYVFLFCHPLKGPSVLWNLYKKNNLFLCVCHLFLWYISL